MIEVPKVDPVVQMGVDYAKINHDIETMLKAGLQPPSLLISRRLELDRWLTDNTNFWQSNFGYQKERYDNKI